MKKFIPIVVILSVLALICAGIFVGYAINSTDDADVYDYANAGDATDYEQEQVSSAFEASNTIRLLSVNELLAATAVTYVTPVNLVPNIYVTTGLYYDGVIAEDFEFGGTLTVETTIFNNTSSDITAHLIVANFRFDTFIGSTILPMPIPENETESFSIQHQIPYSGVNIVRIMVWEAFPMRPLTMSIELSTDFPSEYTQRRIDVEENREYRIAILGSYVANPNDIITVRFNPEFLEVVDLCDLTWRPVLTAGAVDETNVIITEFNPADGIIRFRVDKPVASDEMLSGVLNVIRFRGLQDGRTNIGINN